MKKNSVIILFFIISIVVVFFVFTKKGAEETFILSEQETESLETSLIFEDEELELMMRDSIELSSFSRIGKDFEDGEITIDQMYAYKLVAMYGIDKLLEKYESNNVNSLRGDGIVMEIKEDWGKLSIETQDILKPFVLSFSNKESFFYHDNHKLRETIIINLAKY